MKTGYRIQNFALSAGLCMGSLKFVRSVVFAVLHITRPDGKRQVSTIPLLDSQNQARFTGL